MSQQRIFICRTIIQWSLLLALFFSVGLFCAGCTTSENTDTKPAISLTEDQRETTLTVRNETTGTEQLFTLEELSVLPNGVFSHLYSTINNWPSIQFYAAEGIRIDSILSEAGCYENASVITFRSTDSYEVSFTKEQLFGETWYYPGVEEASAEGALPVTPILACSYKEGSQDLSEIIAQDPCLIIGQRNPKEHSNPAFVENLSEIVISEEKPLQWESASGFPSPGVIAKGESVKLEHPMLGNVKLYYTTDGSVPTENSALYNPSTYQPEQNVPILIEQDTVIRVLVCGYGKTNSEITSLEYHVQ